MQSGQKFLPVFYLTSSVFLKARSFFRHSPVSPESPLRWKLVLARTAAHTSYVLYIAVDDLIPLGEASRRSRRIAPALDHGIPAVWLPAVPTPNG